MSERLGAVDDFEIRQGNLSQEQWRLLGQLATTFGAECVALGGVAEAAESEEPVIRVSIRDFQEFAVARGTSALQGSKAYTNLARIAQRQRQESAEDFNTRLPKLEFDVVPSDSVPWSWETHELDGLDVLSLKRYVAAVDGFLGRMSKSGQGKIYYSLGHMIGPKTLSFWRDFADSYNPDGA